MSACILYTSVVVIIYVFCLFICTYDRYDYGDSNLRKLTVNKSFAMDQTDDLIRNTLNLCSEFTKELYRKLEKCLLKLINLLRFIGIVIVRTTI